MYQGKRIVGVIPARGGSRRVARKNLVSLAGRPLLAYTADQAERVPELDRVVVSSEDAEIKEVARSLGLGVIDRPSELAGDETRTEPVLVHALDVLAADGEQDFNIVVTLEPTSPLRRAATISACIRKLVESGAESLVTVHETRDNIGRLDDGGCFQSLQEDDPRRTQDRQPLYVECGVVYACTADHLRRTGSIVAGEWLVHVVDREEALDINDPWDVTVADAIISERGTK